MSHQGQKMGPNKPRGPLPRGIVKPTEKKLDVARRYREGQPPKVIFLETGVAQTRVQLIVREVLDWERFERSRGGL